MLKHDWQNEQHQNEWLNDWALTLNKLLNDWEFALVLEHEVQYQQNQNQTLCRLRTATEPELKPNSNEDHRNGVVYLFDLVSLLQWHTVIKVDLFTEQVDKTNCQVVSLLQWQFEPSLPLWKSTHQRISSAAAMV